MVIATCKQEPFASLQASTACFLASKLVVLTVHASAIPRCRAGWSRWLRVNGDHPDTPHLTRGSEIFTIYNWDSAERGQEANYSFITQKRKIYLSQKNQSKHQNQALPSILINSSLNPTNPCKITEPAAFPQ